MSYPIKFKPILKDRIWGGSFLGYKNMDDFHLRDGVGESWEISGLEDNVSGVINGELEGNSLSELTEVYMGDMVGDAVYEKFGNTFPLLLKMIDTSAQLSVQVHPNDELAKERHESYGKSELWYIMNCAANSYIYLGLKRGVTKEDYLEAVKKGEVENILSKKKVNPGDFFYVPAGAVHAMGPGITAVEMQQPSDITYRIFDWKRKDDKGKERELHTELAIDAIDFGYSSRGAIHPELVPNQWCKVNENDYFVTSVIALDGQTEADLSERDSFSVYVCVEGVAFVVAGGVPESLDCGDVVLIPNDIDNITISGKGKILEFYVPVEDGFTPEEE